MIVNGKEVTLINGEMSLKAFLEDAGYTASRVVVERNMSIVPKVAYEETFLLDTDSLEIVHFVGGG